MHSSSKRIRLLENPCPNHNSVRVPRTYGYQRIHDQNRWNLKKHRPFNAARPTSSTMMNITMITLTGLADREALDACSETGCPEQVNQKNMEPLPLWFRVLGSP